MRGGSNLPPGCSMRDIERALGGDADETCWVCGRDAYDCICPECPECRSVGTVYTINGILKEGGPS